MVYTEERRVCPFLASNCDENKAEQWISINFIGSKTNKTNALRTPINAAIDWPNCSRNCSRTVTDSVKQRTAANDLSLHFLSLIT